MKKKRKKEEEEVGVGSGSGDVAAVTQLDDHAKVQP